MIKFSKYIKKDTEVLKTKNLKKKLFKSI